MIYRKPPIKSFSIKAFTLIELIISIAISTLILYGSFSAVNVANQSIAISRQLSLENNMLRTGIYAALDEIDFWDHYDNRYAVDPAQNPLRSPGKPFCSLTYDPSKKGHEPQTWWRGFGFSEKINTTKKWGDYLALSRVGHEDPIRAWYPDQADNIHSCLGLYAMLDYLPGNSIYCWYKFDSKGKEIQFEEPRDIWERTMQKPITINGEKYDVGESKIYTENKPENWPGLEIETRRYVVWSHSIDLCQIKISSPITGKLIQLSFWGVGTTLRGARQQRNLDTVEIK